jgi:hypothetical protein
MFTVTNKYYACSFPTNATAQQSLEQATRALKISQDLGAAGSGSQRRRKFSFNDAQRVSGSEAAMETTRLNLTVLLFLNIEQNFAVVDDLNTAQPLPSLAEVRALA